MAASGHFGLPKITFDRISRHFRSIRNFFFNLFTKWLPAAILDDRKSLSIAFLAISDHYATLIFFTKWLPAAILDYGKSLSITFFVISDQYATLIFFSTKWLSTAILDDRKSLLIAFLAISDQYATFFFTKWLPAAIFNDRKSLLIAFLAISDQYATFDFFFYKMAAGGHVWWPKITFDHISRHFRSTLHTYKHPLCCGVGKIESLENTMFPCMVCLLQQ